MAIVSNASHSYNTIGHREQLSDLISNITPVDCPLQMMARKGKVEGRDFEWQTDSLTAATFGAGALEGEASVTAAFTPTVRLKGYAMIRELATSVSGTEQAIKKAGRSKDEMAYQLIKKAKELKRHIESELINNGTHNAGNTTTARQTRGLYGWLDLNASVSGAGSCALGNTAYAAGAGVTGDTLAAPTGSASLSSSNNYAPVAGTARTFTDTLMNAAHQSAFQQGGTPDVIMMTPAHRTIFSTFTGGNTRFDDASDGVISKTIKVYESDFGTLKAVTNRFIDTATNGKTVYILQPDTLAVNYVRENEVTDLAKTGDYESKLLLSEFGLQVDNVAANATVRDLS